MAVEGLHDEIANHAPVIRQHARAVSIEDARHLDLQPMLTIVIKEQRFGAALALVIARARADGIDSPPVCFGLRMHLGISVDFTGRGLQYPRLDPLCQSQHVYRTVHARFGGLHRIELIVNRGSRTSEIEDAVDLNIKRKCDVMTHRFKQGIAQQVGDVALAAGKVVVDTQDVVPVIDQLFAKMRPDKSRAAGNQNFHCPCLLPCVRVQTVRPSP